MTNARPCAPKNLSEVTREWDRLADERHRQITSGDDLSFEHVLVPMAIRLLEGADCSLVLDFGSGTGDFTARLACHVKKAIGIEPSHASVELARTSYQEMANVRFIHAAAENAESALDGELPTAAIAAMTLMTVPNLDAFAFAVGELLPKGAMFVATFSHPWFWPRYWGYDSEPWFNYSTEIFIEAPFAISRHRTEIRTTHIHRPLETYVGVFEAAGFRLITLIEPVPDARIQALYPQPWLFPRFIGMKWEKVR